MILSKYYTAIIAALGLALAILALAFHDRGRRLDVAAARLEASETTISLLKASVENTKNASEGVRKAQDDARKGIPAIVAAAKAEMARLGATERTGDECADAKKLVKELGGYEK